MAEVSNQEILEKAIQKAIDSGWQGFWGKSKKLDSVITTNDAISGIPTVTISIRHNARIFGYGGIPIFNIIYNHDFTKALWGEHDTKPIYGDGEKCKKCGGLYIPYEQDTLGRNCWTNHLQRMVIAEDPIKYLGENI